MARALAPSVHVAGGPSAPAAARRSVLSGLGRRLTEREAGDVALVVSELVGNSVRHAAVGPDRAIGVDVLLLDDRVRVVVADPGADTLPRVSRRGGLGLVLVDAISASWGVARDGSRVTRVWADVPLDPPAGHGHRPHPPHALASLTRPSADPAALRS